MKCSEITNLFTDYSDNTLPPESLGAFREHLASCAHCAAEWQAFRQTIQLVTELEPLTPPADLLPGIHRKMEAEQAGIWQRLRGLFESMDFTMSIPTAAATIGVAMIAAFIVKTAPVEHPGQVSQPDRRAAIERPGANITAQSPRILVPDSLYAARARSSSHSIPTMLPVTTQRQRYALPTLAAHQSPHTAERILLSPDLRVTVDLQSRDEHAHLLQQLQTKNWQMHVMRNGLLLIHLPPNQLADLQGVLSGHLFAQFPPHAMDHDFSGNKRMLTVAVRLQ